MELAHGSMIASGNANVSDSWCTQTKKWEGKRKIKQPLTSTSTINVYRLLPIRIVNLVILQFAWRKTYSCPDSSR